MADNRNPPSVRKLKHLKEYKQCETLQRKIWRRGSIEIVPSDLLITMQRHGGLVLGAFNQTKSMIGFLAGFLGSTSTDNSLTRKIQFQHCSHVMGILPEWQGQGIGYKLKLEQREHVIQQGINLITWTYDPLEIPNAILNIHKLGALCRCYLEDIYGNMSDELNSGIPSDRFEVVWKISSERVKERVSKSTFPIIEDWEKLTIVNQSSQIANGFPVPSDTVLDVDDKILLIEVPNYYQEIKRQDIALALDWRSSTQDIFQKYFKLGFVISDVIASKKMASFYYVIEPIEKIR